MANYIIAGGTGFVGTHLSKLLLDEHHSVFILSTKEVLPISDDENLRYIHWDPSKRFIDSAFQLDDCHIINLAGAGVVEKRWTNARKIEILESRTHSLQTLFQAVEKKQLKATHLVSASAIGFYGEAARLFTEKDPSDDSFLSATCRKWEEAAWQFAQLNLPVAIARIGIVLGHEGGAFKELIKTLPFGIAGIPSDGKQIYSWIHVDDVCRVLYFLSMNHKEGIFNAVAPYPCSVNTIFDEITKRHKSFLLKMHVPQFVLDIMLGEMAEEVLKSAFVSSKKIEDEGFDFLYPDIQHCVAKLMP